MSLHPKEGLFMCDMPSHLLLSWICLM